MRRKSRKSTQRKRSRAGEDALGDLQAVAVGEPAGSAPAAPCPRGGRAARRAASVIRDPSSTRALGRRLGADADRGAQRGRGLARRSRRRGRGRAPAGGPGRPRRRSAAISREPDGRVDRVVLAPAVAAEAGDDEARRRGSPCRSRSRGAPARRGGSRRACGRCAPGLSSRSAGPPSAATMRGEALGGGAVVERACAAARAASSSAAQPRLDEQRGGQRERHLVQARLARARR